MILSTNKGTMLMRILLAILSLGLILGLDACTRPADSKKDDDSLRTTDRGGNEIYTCPMHPSVRSDRPGVCPICGMALVRRSVPSEAAGDVVGSLEEVSLSASQRVAANVSTKAVGRGRFIHTVRAVGLVDFAEPNQATVAARFRGRIEKLYVNFTGQLVQRGEPLFEMHSPDLITAEQEYILALRAREGEGADASAAHDRMVAAAEEKLIVHFGMTREQIRHVAESPEAHSSVTFQSPIRGTVVAKEIQEGEYVDEGTLLYKLVDLSTVWAYLDVYEQDLRFIKRGQRVMMTADAYPGEAFEGRVAFIDPVVDPQTRSVRVRVVMGNAGEKLKPQMFVTAVIQVAVENVLIVPPGAILFTGKRDVAWVEVKPNVFESRDVVVGVQDDEGVEILGGLKEGEMVATTGGFMIESESQLQQPASPASVSPPGGTAPPASKQK